MTTTRHFAHACVSCHTVDDDARNPNSALEVISYAIFDEIALRISAC